MEKKNKLTLVLTVAICLLPMILGIVLYNRLPEQMPIHFNIKNEPDNYASKNFALFGIPVIMAIVQAIALIFSNSVKTLKDNEKPKMLKICEWIIPIFTVVVYIIMIEVPLGSTVYVGKSICLILGILFIIIGNYAPKMSYEIGKKIMHPVPKDEKSFRKVNRILAYSLITLGIIFMILIIFV